jgi:hypothetical protein
MNPGVRDREAVVQVGPCLQALSQLGEGRFDRQLQAERAGEAGPDENYGAEEGQDQAEEQGGAGERGQE